MIFSGNVYNGPKMSPLNFGDVPDPRGTLTISFDHKAIFWVFCITTDYIQYKQ